MIIPDVSAPEFRILQVLWKHGNQSVREVHDQLASKTGWAYSTTKTTMDRMSKKGILKRESFHGVFLYKTLISKSQGLVKWVRFIADGILDTDYSNVITMFNQTSTLSAKEIEELKTLLEDDKGTTND